MTASATIFKVYVAHATPARQCVLECEVPAGSTMLDAVRRSGILQVFPDSELDQASMGIFGEIEPDPGTRLLREGDRVELYRPLLVDPRQQRQARAARQRLTLGSR